MAYREETILRRFIVAYRWELWLVVGIPAMAYLVALVALYSTSIWGFTIPAISVYSLVEGVTRILLLTVSYPRVRKLGRDFLAVLWGYVVVATVIGTISSAASYTFRVFYPEEELAVVLGRTLSIVGLALLLKVLALLWFARRASRYSLTHAAFLIVFASLAVVKPPLGSHAPGFLNIQLLLVYTFIGISIALGAALAKVWLLGAFDSRGIVFRRNAVMGLAAVLILSPYAREAIGYLIGLVEGPHLTILPMVDRAVVGFAAFAVTVVIQVAVLLALFAIVYVVRERSAATGVEPDTEDAAGSAGEER